MKKMKIALLIPTRGRSESIKNILEEYKTYGGGYTDVIMGVDTDDPKYLEYMDLLGKYDNLFVHIGPRKRLGPTLNDMATIYAPQYYILGFIGDDMRPRSEKWDISIITEMAKIRSGFVHGDDGHWGEQLATQIFVSSDIIEKLGYMVPPGMIHMYLDNFWSEFARAIDRFSYRGDIKIDHLHPAWGKAEMDESYLETNTNERMNQDRALFEEYKRTKMQEDVGKFLNG